MSSTPEAPHRVRLSRKKGWRLPAHTKVCSRPGKYSNPFVIADLDPASRVASLAEFQQALHRSELRFDVDDIIRDLAGWNLACWCSLDVACHVDILLAIANGTAITLDLGGA